MKFFFILSSFLFILTSGKIFSQNISLDYDEKTLVEILLDLHERYEIQVSVSSKLSSKCQISIHQNALSINEAINMCADACNLDVLNIGGVFTFRKKKKKNSFTRPNKKYLFQGNIIDKKSLEPLPYSKITFGETTISTNYKGRFSFKSSKSIEKVIVKYLGYNVADTALTCSNNLIIQLCSNIEYLEEFEVISEQPKVHQATIGDQAGIIELNNIGAKFIAGLNNNIVFNNLRMYPGIMASGESTSDYIIWGSYPGQGLITYDGITLFSSSGMNGNMGRVNPLVIQNIQTYKGGYNVDIGDRIGSAIIIDSKDGEKKTRGEFNFDNQITSAYASLPIFNKSSTIQIAARKSYFNSLNNNKDSKLKSNYVYPNYDYSDLNIKFSSTLKNKDQIQISSISSLDKHNSFLDKKDISSYYSNLEYDSYQIGNSLKYLHNWEKGGLTNLLMTQSLFTPTELFVSSYFDSISSNENYWSGYKNGIEEYLIRIEHTLPATKNNQLKFSISNILNRTNYHSLENLDFINSYESSLNRISSYLKDNLQLFKNLFEIQLGLKTDFLSSNNNIYTQPRINGKININDNWRISYGWGKYNQYLSKTQIVDAIGTTSFIWSLLDDDKYPVQHSTHNVLSLTFNGTFLESGIDGYHKSFSNLGIYSSDDIYSNLDNINGSSIGVDFFSRLRYKTHQILLSYSISRINEQNENNVILRFNGEAPQSQRHEFKTSLNLQFKPITIALSGVYGSGHQLLTNKQNEQNPYSRIDIALEYKKLKYSYGLSILNLLNSPNTRLFQTTRFNDGSSYYTSGLTFTPTVFLNFKF